MLQPLRRVISLSIAARDPEGRRLAGGPALAGHAGASAVWFRQLLRALYVPDPEEQFGGIELPDRPG